MQPTQHQDINEILDLLKKGLISILDKNLTSLYLTGSLTYGDFIRGSSDIDFLVVLNNALSEEKLQDIEKLHSSIGMKYPKWRKRIDGSYIPIKLLSSTERPSETRPYYNAGQMWNLVYGNEWLLELYMLRERGIVIIGPDPKEIIGFIDIDSVREASKKSLLEEWQPKLKNPNIFTSDDYDNSHLQAYAILTMCRILYTVNNEDVVSKKTASEWVKSNYESWSKLIEKAQDWKHGEVLDMEGEIKDFIRFVIKEVEVK